MSFNRFIVLFGAALLGLALFAFLTREQPKDEYLRGMRACMEAQHDFDVEYGVVGHYDNVSICKNAVAEPEWYSYDRD